MKKSLVKNSVNSVEKITISTKTIEYDYAYEENDLVHLEMNLIELPFFNKNGKIKKNTSIIYNFNKDKTSYLQVKPGYDLPIPGEKEEKIFYALLKIFQKNDFMKNRYCYTDYYEIIKEMELGYSGKNKDQVRKGLEILRGADYEFQNSFYTKIEGEHHKVSFNELKKLLNITFITLDKTSNEEERELFTNNKKEIIKIELSDFIKKNILNKIFLYFSKQDLMSLENAVTRNLWIKLTKWRNGKLFLKVSSKNIATRIPLSWTPSTYSKTIIIIKKSLEDLMEKNLLKSYKFINMDKDKKIKNEKTYFEIYFDELHNEKRNSFSLGREESSFQHDYDTNIEHIEYKPREAKKSQIEEAKIVENKKIGEKNSRPEKTSRINISLEVELLYNLLNERGKKLSTIKGKIEKALKKNSFEDVKVSILYTNKNSKTSYGKYFTDTLENKWYEESKELLLSELEISQMNPEEIRKKLEEFELIQAITYAKRNQYVIKEWNSSVEEKLLKIALDTKGDYVAMIIKTLYSRVAKPLTKSLNSVIDSVISENSFDNFIKKSKVKKPEIEAEIVEKSEEKSHIKTEVLESKKVIAQTLFNFQMKTAEVNEAQVSISKDDKILALKYLREKEAEKLNLRIYEKRCEMGMENSQENITLLKEVLKRYKESVQEIPKIREEIQETPKNIIKTETYYEDIVSFKVGLYDYIFDKVSEGTLKQIMNFLNIESHYKREIENYRMEFKFNPGEKSLISIEELG